MVGVGEGPGGVEAGQQRVLPVRGALPVTGFPRQQAVLPIAEASRG